MTHFNTEEIAQADLIDVIGDVLIVHEIGSRNIAVSRLDRNVGLKNLLALSSLWRLSFDLPLLFLRGLDERRLHPSILVGL
jgi:hypothetical protein